MSAQSAVPGAVGTPPRRRLEIGDGRGEGAAFFNMSLALDKLSERGLLSALKLR
jgi:hypothetical protein